MNFLVTGGAGFIGSHVCERLLQAGHAVWALDDLNLFYSPTIKQRNLEEIKSLGRPFTFIHGDLTDITIVRDLLQKVRFDQVIHLAARAGVRPSLAEPELYQQVNVVGTANILETARRNGVKKILLASSSSVYGVNQKNALCRGRPGFLHHFALRRQQARVRGARPRLLPRLWHGRRRPAVLHRLRPAPAA